MTADAPKPSSALFAAPVTFAQVLRNRQFLFLWLAQLISSFGDWLAILALFSLVTFRWHGSAYAVSGIFLSFAGPFALLGPLAGVFVDRWHLKRTMIASDLIRAALVLGLVWATELWQVFTLMALLSAVSTFFLPAQSATIPLLVRREGLLVANALNAQTVHLTKIVGPAVAGLLVAWAGEQACFGLDALTFLISAALLARITTQRPAVERAGGIAAVLTDLRQGLDFLWNHAALRFVVLAMVAAIFAIGAFDALIAVYVRDILAAESRVFGLLVAIIGVGTIVGSAVIGKYGQHWSRVGMVILGILGLALGVAWLAATARVDASLSASLWMGLAVGMVLVPAQTLTQEETPHEILGRVSSTALSLITISQLAAVAVAGRIAAWIGIRNLYYATAAALALIAVVGYLFARSRRLLRRAAAHPESPVRN